MLRLQAIVPARLGFVVWLVLGYRSLLYVDVRLLSAMGKRAGVIFSGPDVREFDSQWYLFVSKTLFFTFG